MTFKSRQTGFLTKENTFADNEVLNSQQMGEHWTRRGEQNHTRRNCPEITSPTTNKVDLVSKQSVKEAIKTDIGNVCI